MALKLNLTADQVKQVLSNLKETDFKSVLWHAVKEGPILPVEQVITWYLSTLSPNDVVALLRGVLSDGDVRALAEDYGIISGWPIEDHEIIQYEGNENLLGKEVEE